METKKLRASAFDEFWQECKLDNYDEFILYGGRSSFKSSVISLRLVVDFLKNPESSVACFIQVAGYIGVSLYEQIKWALVELGVYNFFEFRKNPYMIKYKYNSSAFYFYGLDDPMKLKGITLAHGYFGALWFEEVAEYKNEDVINQVRATFIRKDIPVKVKTFYSYNPPRNKNSWINNWLKTKTKAFVHHSTYLDDDKGFLSEQSLEIIEDIKKVNENYYRWLYLGEIIGVGGLVYSNFDISKHVMKNSGKYSRVGIAVDYGQMNATTFQCFALDIEDKSIKGIAEYYHSGRESGKQKTPSEYALDFRKFYDDIKEKIGQPPVYLIIDPSARGLQEEIKRIVPSIRVLQCENSVDLGISRVQKLLMFDKLILDESQVNVIKEMELYSYDEKSIERGKEKPIKDNDHTLDALRYYVATLWNRIKHILPRGLDND